LKGSPRLVEDLERKLGIKAGQTTKDLAFTLETVNCLGCCALSPVVVMDGQYLARATSKKVEKTLKDLSAA
jgi:NADH-quinone oxidoreductase subunit E